MNRGGSAPCAGLPPTPTGSGFGLSANLASATSGYSALGTTVANASPTPVVVAGVLVGAMPACDAFVKQLPRATPGSLGLAGTPTALTFAALGGTRLRVPGRTLYPRADGSCSPQASVLPGTRHTSVCDFRNVVVGAALIKVQFMGGVGW